MASIGNVSYDTYLRVTANTVQTQLQDLEANLTNRLASQGAVIHEDGVNTDCNSLTNGKHVVYSDGANATTPASAGLYVIEQEYISTEEGASDAISQIAWRYSTGKIWTRLYRNSAWSVWNAV
jgi:hypothetical protein